MGDEGNEVADLLRVVLGDPDAEFDGEPVRLEGGCSAELFRFRLLVGPPAFVGRELVVRLIAEGVTAIDECVIQSEVARLGFPAPHVLGWGTVEPRRVYMVMRFVEGVSLFAAQHPLRGLRRVPAQLAELMMALHRLDPASVRESLTRLGSSAALDARAWALAELDACLASIAHPARGELRAWFDEHQPEPDRQVVCHGDLHALNVLVNGDATVLDWELAALGDAAFDVARTKLLLHAVPMGLPRAARPLIERLGQRAASRFEDAYTSLSPMPTDALRWYEALHTARMAGLVLAKGTGIGPVDHVLEAWRPALPLLATSVMRTTGISMLT